MPSKADPEASIRLRWKTSVRRWVLLILFCAILSQFRSGLRVTNKYDPRVRATTDATKTVRFVTAETNTDDKHKDRSRHFLTQNSTVLPLWFKDYVNLHREQRLALNETNWKNQRFLIMRCLDFDDACGGASDRLSSIPAMLLLANRTRRMLFIKWSRPAPLQEFLVPPEGGLDWTIPDWLDIHLDFRKLPLTSGRDPQSLELAESSAQIMTFRILIHDHRFEYYNTRRGNKNELGFHLVYRDMWDTLFTPSPPVAALIHQNMNDLNLVPGEYVATHVRALYRYDESSDTVMIHNAINCATKLKPALPIYFASDSSNAIRIARQYSRMQNSTIVARIADTEPLHLDRGNAFLLASDGWKNLRASDFYDIFVDLYMLAGSQCVTYGVGGYGMWGSFLSHNSSCYNHHHKEVCHWTEQVPQKETVSSESTVY
jgi:hypothetical protein